MPKFKKGDRVLYQGAPATIEEVHLYMPKADGTKKRMIWYEVRYEGFRSHYCVSQKVNSLRKIKGE